MSERMLSFKHKNLYSGLLSFCLWFLNLLGKSLCRIWN
uniref:Uncharacterized protein n=1 Tax=uncultured Desulfobacterium sp. TaxID=201089 RepID=E1Y9X9_9BACT|nr:unknown protein [uncultured Desulfobacterium sp.]